MRLRSRSRSISGVWRLGRWAVGNFNHLAQPINQLVNAQLANQRERLRSSDIKSEVDFLMLLPEVFMGNTAEERLALLFGGQAQRQVVLRCSAWPACRISAAAIR